MAITYRDYIRITFSFKNKTKKNGNIANIDVLAQAYFYEGSVLHKRGTKWGETRPTYVALDYGRHKFSLETFIPPKEEFTFTHKTQDVGLKIWAVDEPGGEIIQEEPIFDDGWKDVFEIKV